VPGIPGISDNIEAISIVDRFLEHARIQIFANGGNPQYYITSADWMVRNFDNRIEVATPILDPEIKQQIQKIIDIQLADNVKARVIGSGTPNEYRKIDGPPVRAQIETYNYLKKKVE
jgi:polyphosphate kinase